MCKKRFMAKTEVTPVKTANPGYNHHLQGQLADKNHGCFHSCLLYYITLPCLPRFINPWHFPRTVETMQKYKRGKIVKLSPALLSGLGHGYKGRVYYTNRINKMMEHKTLDNLTKLQSFGLL